MPKIKKKAYAKLDLAISITPNRSTDGYFPVQYIDCQIDVFDTLTFEKKEGDIEIICSRAEVPTDEENFIYKAAVILKDVGGDKNLGAKIILDKRIPVKAGFGGGSSDGAAAVWGLSELWNIQVDEQLVKRLAKELGKDFFYSLFGGISEISGEGKDYKRVELSGKLPLWAVAAVPFAEKPSTAWVYENLKTEKLGGNSGRIEKLKKAIAQGNRKAILENLTNDFEDSVCSFYPVVSKIKEELLELGAGGAIMAGAGLSVVGFFESRDAAQKASGKLNGLKEVHIGKIV